jgi:hypothetical protein
LKEIFVHEYIEKQIDEDIQTMGDLSPRKIMRRLERFPTNYFVIDARFSNAGAKELAASSAYKNLKADLEKRGLFIRLENISLPGDITYAAGISYFEHQMIQRPCLVIADSKEGLAEVEKISRFQGEQKISAGPFDHIIPNRSVRYDGWARAANNLTSRWVPEGAVARAVHYLAATCG